jgi:hypothetical protein
MERKAGGNWGVKMSYFSKKNIYNIIDYLMERIHETPPNIYIYKTEKLWIIAIIFLSLVSYLPQILSN